MRALAFGAGLCKLGCEPLPLSTNKAVLESFAPIDGPHCVLVFEEVGWWWCMSSPCQRKPGRRLCHRR